MNFKSKGWIGLAWIKSTARRWWIVRLVATNIVLVWNTIYIQEILQELKNEGYQVNEDDFKHISPAPFEHINRLGKYNFKEEIQLEENGLRALRKPKKRWV